MFCVDRAGLNAADGATHHGIFDVAYLSQVPDLVIDAPLTDEALRLSLREALQRETPSAIRYPNGCESFEVTSRFYPQGLNRELSCCADFEQFESVDDQKDTKKFASSSGNSSFALWSVYASTCNG